MLPLPTPTVVVNARYGIISGNETRRRGGSAGSRMEGVPWRWEAHNNARFWWWWWYGGLRVKQAGWAVANFFDDSSCLAACCS